MSLPSQQRISSSELAQAKTELQSLKVSLAAQPFASGSLVSKSIAAAIREVQAIIDLNEEANLAMSASSPSSAVPASAALWRLKIRTPDSQTIVLAAVSPLCTMRELRSLIEGSLDRPLAIVRLRVASTGSAWGTFDDKTIQSCAIQNNDVLTVEVGAAAKADPRPPSTSSTSASAAGKAVQLPPTPASASSITTAPAPTGLARLPRDLFPATRFEAIVLALHCYMLDQGFVCVAEVKNQQNQVSGFAPPMRE